METAAAAAKVDGRQQRNIFCSQRLPPAGRHPRFLRQLPLGGGQRVFILLYLAARKHPLIPLQWEVEFADQIYLVLGIQGDNRRIVLQLRSTAGQDEALRAAEG